MTVPNQLSGTKLGLKDGAIFGRKMLVELKLGRLQKFN